MPAVLQGSGATWARALNGLWGFVKKLAPLEVGGKSAARRAREKGPMEGEGVGG